MKLLRKKIIPPENETASRRRDLIYGIISRDMIYGLDELISLDQPKIRKYRWLRHLRHLRTST